MSQKTKKPTLKPKGEIKLTNQELRLLMMSDGMQRLIDARNISPKLKFQTLMLTKKLSEILETVEKVRREIIEQYAERDKYGRQITVNNLVQFGTNKKEATEKLDELMGEEVTLSGGKIAVDLDGDAVPKDLLSARDMMALSAVIEFKE